MAGKTRYAFIGLMFLLLSTAQAAAMTWNEFSQAAFDAAQAEGGVVVVDIYADWCPTCKAQKPILDEIATDPTLADAVLMRVNFDTEKDFLASHRIPRQSTILVFIGDKEVSRTIAETDAARLRSAILDPLSGQSGAVE